MKAVRLLEYGGELVFSDVPTPTIARDEVLVKIRSTAVNHLDLVEASGTARQILPIDLPWIPGHEFSGVVEQIGSDVAAYAPGDRWRDTETVVPRLEGRWPSRIRRSARIAGRGSDAPCVGRDDAARAVRGRARQNRANARRGDNTTRRCDR